MRVQKTLMIVILLLLPLSQALAAGVAVVPLFTGKTLDNVVTVSPTGADFTDPVAAVASITDAATDNRYQILIGPGIYTLSQQLVLPDYVSLTGAGESTTVLKGAVGGDDYTSSALISCGSNQTVANLRIENFADSANLRCLGIYIGGSSVNVQGVYVYLAGGQRSAGIYCEGNSATIKNSTVWNLTNATNNFGIFIDGDYITVSDCNISATPLYIFGTSTAYSCGVAIASGSPVLSNLQIQTGTTTNTNIGLRIEGSSSAPVIMDSLIKGGDYGVYFVTADIVDARLQNNMIQSPVHNDPAGAQCGGNYDYDDMSNFDC